MRRPIAAGWWRAALLCSSAVIGLSACANAGPEAAASEPVSQTADVVSPWRSIDIEAKAVGGGKSYALTVGTLDLAGAMVLTSPDKDFGGFSAMRLGDDGTTLVMLSDRAMWLRADVAFDEAGAISGLSNARMTAMTGADGAVITGMNADAEGLALTEGGALVGFERRHRIDRYVWSDGAYALSGTVLPNLLLKGLPGNGSLEAIDVLTDGRIVAIAEDGSDPRRGWISDPQDQSSWSEFTYQSAEDFSPTDMAQDAATGDIYVVERAYSPVRGVRARLTRFAASELEPGAAIVPEELARLNLLHGIDNMEGLELTRTADGQLMVHMISDDNFSLAQRTILMSWSVTNRNALPAD